jgi:hypothetical protein
MSKKNLHVVANTSGGWSVRTSGASRASGIFKTQSDAVRHAKAVAKEEAGEVYIHGADGRIREKTTYGSDALPPRDETRRKKKSENRVKG